MEQNVDGVEFFAHDGNDAPAERELLIGARIGGHADDVDHGAEAGDHARRAARPRADDDALCADVLCHSAGGVRKRFVQISDFISRLVEGLDVLGVLFRLDADPRHCLDGFDGVESCRRLTREHDRGGTVVDGVRDVRNFRTGGAGLFDHGFEHLRCGDDALAFLAAGGNDVFLNVGELFEGDFHAEIAAGDHDALRLVDDLFEVVDARAVLDLGDEVDVFAADRIDEVSHVDQVLRFGDERAGNEFDALLHAEGDVLLVLLGEVFHVQVFVGEEHGFVVGSFAADEHFRDDVRLFDFDDFEHDEAVVQEDLVADIHLLADALVGHRDPRLVAHDLFRREGERRALFQRDFLVAEGADAEFRSFGVKHDGQGDLARFPNVLDDLDFLGVIFVRAVGEIQPRHVHARVVERGNDFFFLARRSERADDFCLFHDRPSLS